MTEREAAESSLEALKVKYNDVSRECAELRETVKRNLAEEGVRKIIVELNQQQEYGNQ